MHDLSYFRENLDVFAEMAKRRGTTLDLDAFRVLDKARREFITANEQRKAQRNKASDEIARLKKEKQNADSIIAEMKQLSELIKQTDEKVTEFDARQREMLLTMPNIPHSSVPTGTSAADNVEVRRWGAPFKYDFQPKPHWEIGEKTGILDLGAATKITGARFALYKGWGARLERALANFFLDVHTREHGYTEILPPFLVNTASLTGAGQLPKFAADLFKIQDTDFWLTPTRSRATQSLSRRNDSGGQAADSRDRLDGLLPVGSGSGGEGYARNLAPASISKGRTFQVRAPGEKLRRARSVNEERGNHFAEAGLALPDNASVQRRYGVCVGEDLRH